MSDDTLSIEERRRRREQFLQALYDVTGGDPAGIVNLQDIGADLGWSHGESWDVRSYLGREGLIQGVTGVGGISITHEGAKIVESWRAGPHERLHPEEAGGGNVIQIGTAINTQIQQESDGSSQRLSVSDQTIGDIESMVSQLKESLEDLGLSQDDEAEVTAQIATAEGQLASRRPKLEIVKSALTDIHEVMSAAKGIGATAAPLLLGLGKLIAGL